MRDFSEAISINAAGTTYSSAFDISRVDTPLGIAEVALALPTVTGTTPSLTATPQISIDGSNWMDAKDLAAIAIIFSAVTAAMAANTAVHQYLPRTSLYIRVKYVVTAVASPVFIGKLLIAAR